MRDFTSETGRQDELFVNSSTLAWCVSFPAYLVIVKGTENHDGKTRRYVDYPITDVLQMMGRAGTTAVRRSGQGCYPCARHQEGLL
ncbi:hypothetical protein cypCar_00023457 [Cyprinus carpio]|nr:hypothetical protein cypCar_00023457 [Cyprinus carpio]